MGENSDGVLCKLTYDKPLDRYWVSGELARHWWCELTVGHALTVTVVDYKGEPRRVKIEQVSEAA